MFSVFIFASMSEQLPFVMALPCVVIETTQALARESLILIIITHYVDMQLKLCPLSVSFRPCITLVETKFLNSGFLADF